MMNCVCCGQDMVCFDDFGRCLDCSPLRATLLEQVIPEPPLDRDFSAEELAWLAG